MNVSAWSASAADLFLGAVCAGCGEPALNVCTRCAPAFAGPSFAAWPDPSPAELLAPTRVMPASSGHYEGPVRAALASYKEEGQFGLVKIFSPMLAAAVRHTRPHAPVLLVPVPSSRAATRERGYDAIGQLARSSAKLLRRAGFDARTRQVLRHRTKVAEQSRLSSAARWSNLHGSFEARTSRIPVGRFIIVVDDVLTTGATVAEATRALTVTGHRPAAIATIAATPRRRP